MFKILENFADTRGNAIVVLLGMLVKGHEIKRDVAIYSLAGCAEAEKVCNGKNVASVSVKPNKSIN